MLCVLKESGKLRSKFLETPTMQALSSMLTPMLECLDLSLAEMSRRTALLVPIVAVQYQDL